MYLDTKELNDLCKVASIVSGIVAIGIAFSLLSLPNSGESLPLQYSNYTSDKYQIQFQHPSNWTVEEKTNRFEEGSDIEISNPNVIGGLIGINMYDDLLEAFGTSDLQSAVVDFHNDITTGFEFDYRTIESPTFLNIDGQRSGTFLYTFKDKYDTNPITNAVQDWITFVGDRGYVFNFYGNPETFDSAENTEIRDHFIKSIKFLGANNQTIQIIKRVPTQLIDLIDARKKKQRDKQFEDIKDENLKADLKKGNTLLSYSEFMPQ